MGTVCCVILTTATLFGSAAFADELVRLSPYRFPNVGARCTASGTVAAVFPNSNAAQVVFLREGKVEAGSAEFEFPMEANYGASWIELLEVQSKVKFTLRVRSRQTCGPGVYDYSFTRVPGAWRLSLLERIESTCSEEGIVTDWRRRYDYLLERVVHTEFKNGRPGRTVVERKRFPVFTLADFVPFSEVYER